MRFPQHKLEHPNGSWHQKSTKKMKNHQQGYAYLTLPAHKRLYAVAQLTLPPQGGQGWLVRRRHTSSFKTHLLIKTP